MQQLLSPSSSGYQTISSDPRRPPGSAPPPGTTVEMLTFEGWPADSMESRAPRLVGTFNVGNFPDSHEERAKMIGMSDALLCALRPLIGTPPRFFMHMGYNPADNTFN